MEKKNILITGANKGIGYEIARQAGKKGFHVIIAGRNELKLTEALGKLKSESTSVEMILMDVSKEDSVLKAAEILGEKKIWIDVLINNAGISPQEDRSLKDGNFEILEKIINTNSYGPLRVVRAFLPLMNKPSRIINISSRGGSMSDPVGGWSPAYCASKTLLNAITRHLAYELSGNRISVNAVCPGWVKTDMGGRSAPKSVEQGAETPMWLATEASQSLTGKFLRDKSEIPW